MKIKKFHLKSEVSKGSLLVTELGPKILEPLSLAGAEDATAFKFEHSPVEQSIK